MLNSRQRAYLRSMANDFDTILMIGKGKVSDQVIKQADDALKARELIKCKVLETHDESTREVSEKIASCTKAEVVCVIGNKFILFRKNSKDSKIKLPN